MGKRGYHVLEGFLRDLRNAIRDGHETAAALAEELAELLDLEPTTSDDDVGDGEAQSDGAESDGTDSDGAQLANSLHAHVLGRSPRMGDQVQHQNDATRQLDLGTQGRTVAGALRRVTGGTP